MRAARGDDVSLAPPLCSAVLALQIRSSRFSFPWMLLLFVPVFVSPSKRFFRNKSLSRCYAFLGTRRPPRPVAKVWLRTSRYPRSSAEARWGSERRRRRRTQRTEAALEAAAKPMPRNGGRTRRYESGARGMSPGPP